MPKNGSDSIASAILETLISPNECDKNLEPANVVDALFFLGRGLHRVADALQALGNGNASTQFGAMEAMSMKIGDSIAQGLSEVAEALREKEAS